MLRNGVRWNYMKLYRVVIRYFRVSLPLFNEHSEKSRTYLWSTTQNIFLYHKQRLQGMVVVHEFMETNFQTNDVDEMDQFLGLTGYHIFVFGIYQGIVLKILSPRWKKWRTQFIIHNNLANSVIHYISFRNRVACS